MVTLTIKHQRLQNQLSPSRSHIHVTIFSHHISIFRYTITHKTEFIKNTLKPKWKRFTVPVRTLCNGDYDRSIKVECYDWNSNGTHEIIGSFLTNLRELSRAKGMQFYVSLKIFSMRAGWIVFALWILYICVYMLSVVVRLVIYPAYSI